jgi:hypothetical protein
MSENCEGIWKIVGSRSINYYRTFQLDVARSLIEALGLGTEFGKPTRFTCKNEEVEMAFRQYLRMRQSVLYRDGNFILLAQWGKFINVLGLGEGGVLRNNSVSATLTTCDFVATS